VAQFLVDTMNQMGFSAHVDAAGNAVGIRGNGPVQVMLLGHIDTVPGDIAVRLELDAAQGDISQGILHGRGSVDAKGSFCTFVSAVAAMSPTALERATFTCIGATEEEAPSSKGANFVKTRYQPDFVLIGEPSGWDAVTLGYKGRLVVKISLEKDNFHSAGEGTSAGDDLLTYATRAKIWAEEWGRSRGLEGAFFTVQLTVQSLEASSNGMTQQARAVLGLRLPPELSPLEAQTALEALAEDLHGLTLEFVGHEVPYRGDKDNRLTRALRVAIRAHGGNPRFKLKTGTADMNVVAPHWPVPMVAYGPGDSSLDHTPLEHLPILDYHKAIAVLTQALEGLVAK
jgi:[amino group carrier protein]-lysine/ornithine hydrolase